MRGLPLTIDRINQKQVKVERGMKGLGGCIVRAAPLQLKQVFHNILNNAFEVVPEKTGVVIISDRKEGSSAEIVIRDNGTGIDKGTLKHLFEPFSALNRKGRDWGWR